MLGSLRMHVFIPAALLALVSSACGQPTSPTGPAEPGKPEPFAGRRAGERREIAGMKLIWCPAGRFTMGSPRSEPERRPGEDQVVVTFSRGFWIGRYEVTQAQWRR